LLHKLLFADSDYWKVEQSGATLLQELKFWLLTTIKQAGVQTPESSVVVVENARGFDFWRMNYQTFSAFRYTLIQRSSSRILHKYSRDEATVTVVAVSQAYIFLY